MMERYKTGESKDVKEIVRWSLIFFYGPLLIIFVLAVLLVLLDKLTDEIRFFMGGFGMAWFFAFLIGTLLCSVLKDKRYSEK